MEVKTSALSKCRDYKSALKWPDNCFLQAGDRGIVFSDRGSYATAFFEAFPRDPDTFIRGEGATIAEAEQRAWKKWQLILACPGGNGHEFERRGYKNGGAFCKHCNLFMTNVLEPDEFCRTCGTPTYYTSDIEENYYCENHQRDKPLELWDESDWFIAGHEHSMFLFEKRHGTAA